MSDQARAPAPSSARTPSSSGPASQPSATSDQDTLGNAAVAQQVAGVERDPETFSILGYWREQQLAARSVWFFANEATSAEQFQIIGDASASERELLLDAIPLEAARRFVSPRFDLSVQLDIVLARPGIVQLLPDDRMLRLMSLPQAAPVTAHLSARQFEALVGSEDGAHPMLVGLLRHDRGCDLAYRAVELMQWSDAIEFLVLVDERHNGAVGVVTTWNREKVAGYLDAAMRFTPETFDRFEAMLVRLGLHDEVEAWYRAREAGGP